MSRALDPKIKEALVAAVHTPVYQSVADVLSTRDEQLLDIEVLGPGHVLASGTYALHEGNAIAIPKFNILRAFLPAYEIFKSHLRGQYVAPEELLRATSVILLLDPEHMTAANARKRHIRHIKEQSPTQLHVATDAEFYLIDSLLTSRLHRHTKSPTLWGHRQWLLELSINTQRPVGSLTTALEKLIFVSAERHPRNYYAWCHARYLLDLHHHHRRSGTPAVAQKHEEEPQQGPAAALLETVTGMVKRWCFRHPDDTSGWSFLAVLVERQAAAAPTLFAETLRLVEDLSWRGEAAWCFLRGMVMHRGRLRAGQLEEFTHVLELVHRGGRRETATEELDRQVLANTLKWTELYAESDC
ncbi:Protein prenyltransferase [Cordyceps fumosorosea ARSEF 2679]|uniref:Protein prenyltransferase n=1 Tax=Cordyceps fumosorosea (strain ARSEF 2679) TaxID=1081104 RepID=A0A162LPS2_CORFA|nr:Protein prenyltransferase [Cordyceps fumosorosea ARSEF 2679]OAA73864.1 Protein prenyltransferase [Cordyceps fumosorosea ARSEF 2679]